MRMAKNIRDLTGEKFGIFTVIRRTERPNHLKKRESYWLCRCECGNEQVINNSRLKLYVKCERCGMSNDVLPIVKIKNIWLKMVSRCNNPNDRLYVNYGGRGIKLSEKWDTFDGFCRDMFDSFVKHIEAHGIDNTSIERIDVNKGYNVENCKWATIQEQNMNKRTTIFVEIGGKLITLKDLATQTGIKYSTLQRRHKKGKRGSQLIKPVK